MRTKKKLVSLRLNTETLETLTTLSIRFNISKTKVIEQAIKVYASKKKHYITIGYYEGKEELSNVIQTKPEKPQNNDDDALSFDELMKELDKIKNGQ